MKYLAYLCATLVLAVQLLAVKRAAGYGSVQPAVTTAVTLYADITSSCTISQPETVTLPDIPASVFIGKAPGDLLDDYQGRLNFTVSCSGASHYSLTFTPGGATPTKSMCMATDKAFMQFCLTDDGTVLDFSQGPVVLTKGITSVSTVFGLKPAVGTGTVTAGTVNGIMTVVVAPL